MSNDGKLSAVGRLLSLDDAAITALSEADRRTAITAAANQCFGDVQKAAKWLSLKPEESDESRLCGAVRSVKGFRDIAETVGRIAYGLY